MSRTSGMTLASLILLLLLSACQSGNGKDIVGRWEWDNKLGGAYEFYEDGTGWYTPSIDPFFPNLGGPFKYAYDPKSGVLKMDFGNPKESIWTVTFESSDEISINTGLKKPFPFVRKPLPELPARIRMLLGKGLKGEDFEYIDSKKLEPGWQKDYPPGLFSQKDEETEDWLIRLQFAGEDGPREYILRVGTGWWGLTHLKITSK